MITKLFRVNQAARELGISEAWLRRAELSRRIPKANRDINGWRVYTEEDIATLRRMLFPFSDPGEGRGDGQPEA